MEAGICPKCKATMFQKDGYKECWSCKYRIDNNSSYTSLQNHSNYSSSKKQIGFWDRLSGKGVEMLVDEYSETYGEILLGMHRDITSFRKKISDFEKQFDKYEKIEKLINGNNGKYLIEMSNISKIHSEQIDILENKLSKTSILLIIIIMINTLFIGLVIWKTNLL